MTIRFYKYQGAGNDFVLLDNRDGVYDCLSAAEIHFLCSRRFGVGADGLMMLNAGLGPDTDFVMKYFNADGPEGSMCGNGGRCIVAFAARLGIISGHTTFQAVDGRHEAVIRPDGWVELKMGDVTRVERGESFMVLDTGSPHYVHYVGDLAAEPVAEKGRTIRMSERFREKGINVNFVQRTGDRLQIRTYERGVEDETLACGTGVTAAAIVSAEGQLGQYRIPVKARGGDLEVRFEKIDEQHFRNVWLAGPATFVYSGEITLH